MLHAHVATGKTEGRDRLEAFKERIEGELFSHPVIQDNAYTRWFKKGLASAGQVRDMVLQFSVFSNHFLVVQVKRMVNAGTAEAEAQARQILMNECGVGMDPATGSAEGKTFSAANAHINWLRRLGDGLGIEPMRLGRWELALPSTRKFLKGLDATYGSLDPNIGAGASFAIENWAAHGIGHGEEAESRNFWKELIVGLEAFNDRRRAEGLPPLPLAFFHYHFQLEAGHGANVWHEMERSFSEPGFDEDKFIRGGRLALDAIHAFWLGLDRQRKSEAKKSQADALDRLAELAERWAR